MRQTIEDRLVALEKKVLVLEGGNPLIAKEDLGISNPYESKPGKDIEEPTKIDG